MTRQPLPVGTTRCGGCKCFVPHEEMCPKCGLCWVFDCCVCKPRDMRSYEKDREEEAVGRDEE